MTTSRNLIFIVINISSFSENTLDQMKNFNFVQKNIYVNVYQYSS